MADCGAGNFSAARPPCCALHRLSTSKASPSSRKHSSAPAADQSAPVRRHGQGARSGIHVLVTGPTITALLPAGEKVEGAQVIDARQAGNAGLIDAHWHTMLAAINQVQP